MQAIAISTLWVLLYDVSVVVISSGYLWMDAYGNLKFSSVVRGFAFTNFQTEYRFAFLVESLEVVVLEGVRYVLYLFLHIKETHGIIHRLATATGGNRSG